MTSRELLVLAKHMDDGGAFKKAGRRGNYTTEQLMAAVTANELMTLRYNRFGGEEPVFFESDAQAEYRFDPDADLDEDEIDDLFNGGFEAMFGFQPEE